MARLRFAAFAIVVLLSSMAYAENLCPENLGPSYMDVLLEPPNGSSSQVGTFLYNISGDFIKTPISGGFIILVNQTDITSPVLCYEVTDSQGEANFTYDSGMDGCVDYWFIFCPQNIVAPGQAGVTARELCLNSTKMQNPLPSVVIDKCSGGPTVSDDTLSSQYLLSHNQFYQCNRRPKSYAGLCWPVLLILGILMGASFMEGKNPLAAFDLSSPRMSRGRQYSMRTQQKSFDAMSAVTAFDKMRATASGKNKVQSSMSIIGGKIMDKLGISGVTKKLRAATAKHSDNSTGGKGATPDSKADTKPTQGPTTGTAAKGGQVNQTEKAVPSNGKVVPTRVTARPSAKVAAGARDKENADKKVISQVKQPTKGGEEAAPKKKSLGERIIAFSKSDFMKGVGSLSGIMSEKDKRDNAKSKEQDAEKSVDAKNVSLKEAKDKATNAETAVSTAKSEVKNAETAVSKAEKAVKDAEKKVKEAKTEKEKKEAQETLAQKKKELEKAQATLTEKKKELEKAQKDSKDALIAVQLREGELSAAKDEKLQAQKEADAVLSPEERVKNAEEKLKSAQDKVDEKDGKVDAAQKEVDAAKRGTPEHEKAEQDLKVAKAELEEAKRECGMAEGRLLIAKKALSIEQIKAEAAADTKSMAKMSPSEIKDATFEKKNKTATAMEKAAIVVKEKEEKVKAAQEKLEKLEKTAKGTEEYVKAKAEAKTELRAALSERTIAIADYDAAKTRSDIAAGNFTVAKNAKNFSEYEDRNKRNLEGAFSDANSRNVMMPSTTGGIAGLNYTYYGATQLADAAIESSRLARQGSGSSIDSNRVLRWEALSKYGAVWKEKFGGIAGGFKSGNLGQMLISLLRLLAVMAELSRYASAASAAFGANRKTTMAFFNYGIGERYARIYDALRDPGSIPIAGMVFGVPLKHIMNRLEGALTAEANIVMGCELSQDGKYARYSDAQDGEVIFKKGDDGKWMRLTDNASLSEASTALSQKQGGMAYLQIDRDGKGKMVDAKAYDDSVWRQKNIADLFNRTANTSMQLISSSMDKIFIIPFITSLETDKELIGRATIDQLGMLRSMANDIRTKKLKITTNKKDGNIAALGDTTVSIEGYRPDQVVALLRALGITPDKKTAADELSKALSKPKFAIKQFDKIESAIKRNESKVAEIRNLQTLMSMNAQRMELLEIAHRNSKKMRKLDAKDSLEEHEKVSSELVAIDALLKQKNDALDRLSSGPKITDAILGLFSDKQKENRAKKDAAIKELEKDIANLGKTREDLVAKLSDIEGSNSYKKASSAQSELLTTQAIYNHLTGVQCEASLAMEAKSVYLKAHIAAEESEIYKKIVDKGLKEKMNEKQVSAFVRKLTLDELRFLDGKFAYSEAREPGQEGFVVTGTDFELANQMRDKLSSAILSGKGEYSEICKSVMDKVNAEGFDISKLTKKEVSTLLFEFNLKDEKALEAKLKDQDFLKKVEAVANKTSLSEKIVEAQKYAESTTLANLVIQEIESLGTGLPDALRPLIDDLKKGIEANEKDINSKAKDLLAVVDNAGASYTSEFNSVYSAYKSSLSLDEVKLIAGSTDRVLGNMEGKDATTVAAELKDLAQRNGKISQNLDTLRNMRIAPANVLKAAEMANNDLVEKTKALKDAEKKLEEASPEGKAAAKADLELAQKSFDEAKALSNKLAPVLEAKAALKEAKDKLDEVNDKKNNATPEDKENARAAVYAAQKNYDGLQSSLASLSSAKGAITEMMRIVGSDLGASGATRFFLLEKAYDTVIGSELSMIREPNLNKTSAYQTLALVGANFDFRNFEVSKLILDENGVVTGKERGTINLMTCDLSGDNANIVLTQVISELYDKKEALMDKNKSLGMYNDSYFLDQKNVLDRNREDFNSYVARVLAATADQANDVEYVYKTEIVYNNMVRAIDLFEQNEARVYQASARGVQQRLDGTYQGSDPLTYSFGSSLSEATGNESFWGKLQSTFATIHLSGIAYTPGMKDQKDVLGSLVLDTRVDALAKPNAPEIAQTTTTSTTPAVQPVAITLSAKPPGEIENRLIDAYRLYTLNYTNPSDSALLDAYISSVVQIAKNYQQELRDAGKESEANNVVIYAANPRESKSASTGKDDFNTNLEAEISRRFSLALAKESGINLVFAEKRTLTGAEITEFLGTDNGKNYWADIQSLANRGDLNGIVDKAVIKKMQGAKSANELLAIWENALQEKKVNTAKKIYTENSYNAGMIALYDHFETKITRVGTADMFTTTGSEADAYHYVGRFSKSELKAELGSNVLNQIKWNKQKTEGTIKADGFTYTVNLSNNAYEVTRSNPITLQRARLNDGLSDSSVNGYETTLVEEKGKPKLYAGNSWNELKQRFVKNPDLMEIPNINSTANAAYTLRREENGEIKLYKQVVKVSNDVEYISSSKPTGVYEKSESASALENALIAPDVQAKINSLPEAERAKFTEGVSALIQKDKASEKPLEYVTMKDMDNLIANKDNLSDVVILREGEKPPETREAIVTTTVTTKIINGAHVSVSDAISAASAGGSELKAENIKAISAMPEDQQKKFTEFANECFKGAAYITDKDVKIAIDQFNKNGGSGVFTFGENRVSLPGKLEDHLVLGVKAAGIKAEFDSNQDMVGKTVVGPDNKVYFVEKTITMEYQGPEPTPKTVYTVYEDKGLSYVGALEDSKALKAADIKAEFESNSDMDKKVVIGSDGQAYLAIKAADPNDAAKTVIKVYAFGSGGNSADAQKPAAPVENTANELPPAEQEKSKNEPSEPAEKLPVQPPSQGSNPPPSQKQDSQNDQNPPTTDNSDSNDGWKSTGSASLDNMIKRHVHKDYGEIKKELQSDKQDEIEDKNLNLDSRHDEVADRMNYLSKKKKD